MNIGGINICATINQQSGYIKPCIESSIVQRRVFGQVSPIDLISCELKRECIFEQKASKARLFDSSQVLGTETAGPFRQNDPGEKLSFIRKMFPHYLVQILH